MTTDSGVGAGEERGERADGLGLGGGESGRERQLVGASAGDQAQEFARLAAASRAAGSR
ncbi:hypothetical protein ACFV0D_40560 [Streptomyces sp. NPDC059556]|uniref:hypothetical protein n=1 Tax=Streptomyces sp. NPDC059556 TaxID=3346863 RepID=UPI00369DDEC3